jgi:hemoglobin-like flavoprotein
MSEELCASDRLKYHARGAISTVGTAIHMLGPDPGPLVSILEALGKVHGQYGALPAHYSIVGRALIETPDDILGGTFTNELKTSWTRVYDIISTSVIEAVEADHCRNESNAVFLTVNTS